MSESEKQSLETTVNQPGNVSRPKHFVLFEGIAHTNKKKESVMELGQMRIRHVINTWPNMSEVCLLKFSTYISGVALAVSSFYINFTMRKHLHLMQNGQLLTYVGAFVLPTCLGTWCHEWFVRMHLLDREKEYPCPVCAQVRSGLLQTTFGVVHPALAGAVIALGTMQNLKSYRMPLLHEKPVATLNFTAEILKAPMKKIPILLVLQLGLGMTMAYAEQYQYFNNILPALDLPKSVIRPAVQVSKSPVI